jgi:hypothetical protein
MTACLVLISGPVFRRMVRASPIRKPWPTSVCLPLPEGASFRRRPSMKSAVGMISQDRGEMVAAYALFDGLSRAKETAAATKLAFNDQDWKNLEKYQQLAPITKPEELVQEMNPAVDPQTAKRRSELGATGKKLLDAEWPRAPTTCRSILSHFDPSGPVQRADQLAGRDHGAGFARRLRGGLSAGLSPIPATRPWRRMRH